MTVIRSAAWKEESSSVDEFHKLIKRLDILRKYVFWLLLRSPFDALRTWMTAVMMQSVFQCLQTSDQRTLPLLCIGYGLLCTLLFVYNGVVWSSLLLTGIVCMCILPHLWLNYRLVLKGIPALKEAAQKALGFSLDEIKTVIDGRMEKSLLIEVISRKQKAWKEAADAAEYKRESLDNIIRNVQDSDAAERITKMTEEERAWLLAELICIEELSVQRCLSEALWT